MKAHEQSSRARKLANHACNEKEIAAITGLLNFKSPCAIRLPPFARCGLEDVIAALELRDVRHRPLDQAVLHAHLAHDGERGSHKTLGYNMKYRNTH